MPAGRDSARILVSLRPFSFLRLIPPGQDSWWPRLLSTGLVEMHGGMWVWKCFLCRWWGCGPCAGPGT